MLALILQFTQELYQIVKCPRHRAICSCHNSSLPNVQVCVLNPQTIWQDSSGNCYLSVGLIIDTVHRPSVVFRSNCKVQRVFLYDVHFFVHLPPLTASYWTTLLFTGHENSRCGMCMGMHSRSHVFERPLKATFGQLSSAFCAEVEKICGMFHMASCAKLKSPLK